MKYLAIFLCVVLITTKVFGVPFTDSLDKSEENMMVRQSSAGSDSLHHEVIRQRRGWKGALAGAAVGALAGHFAQKYMGSHRSSAKSMGDGSGNSMGSDSDNSMGTSSHHSFFGRR